MRAIATLVLLAQLSFGITVEWKDRPVVVKVPPYSVLTVDVPCYVQSVVNLSSLVETGFSQKVKVNAVHIAVKDEPTSVGITCEQEGVTKSYNVFVKPSDSGGTTFVKLVDKDFEEEYARKKRGVWGEKDSDLLSHAKALLVAMLRGGVMFGYRVFEGGKVTRSGGFELRPVYVYAGRLTGAVYRVKNVSPMRKVLTPMNFSDKGTVLVWIEGTEDRDSVDVRPGEELYVAVVRTSPSEGKSSTGGAVIPYK
ncbi:hypothetical protein [Hydrogenivirga sp.]